MPGFRALGFRGRGVWAFVAIWAFTQIRAVVGRISEFRGGSGLRILSFGGEILSKPNPIARIDETPLEATKRKNPI